MKKILCSFLLALCLAAAALAAQDKHATPHQEKTHAAAGDDGDVVKRGEPVGKAEAVAFKDVFKEPQKYAGKQVRIEGVVEQVCQAEGCWMQIKPEADAAEGARVTFDHKFVVPKDAGKWKFRAEGKFTVKTLSKEQVEHLVKDDGAKIKTNPDGTANELSFLATGVELWK